MTGIFDVISDKFLFYARVAKLYTQEPDSRIAMPFQDVTKRQVADTWGAPRGVGRRHEGQDIFAPRGTPILSATNGYVYKIGENNLGGQTVSVIGSGGRVYYYAHLDSYAPGLEVGDRVSKRTVLGYVGTTGNAQGTPPHLHFGVYTLYRSDQSSAIVNGSDRTDRDRKEASTEQYPNAAGQPQSLDHFSIVSSCCER